ncbi:MAG: hypothetical protein WD402_01865 [Chloroflexota bacterium]
MLSVATTLAGPQPLPWAACNQYLRLHNSGVEAQSGDETPHLHDFDSDGTSACYHFNVTYPAPGPGDE